MHVIFSLCLPSLSTMQSTLTMTPCKSYEGNFTGMQSYTIDTYDIKFIDNRLNFLYRYIVLPEGTVKTMKQTNGFSGCWGRHESPKIWMDENEKIDCGCGPLNAFGKGYNNTSFKQDKSLDIWYIDCPVSPLFYSYNEGCFPWHQTALDRLSRINFDPTSTPSRQWRGNCCKKTRKCYQRRLRIWQ